MYGLYWTGIVNKRKISMTAEELIKKDESGVYCEQDIALMLIEFAKYHVQEALKTASEKAGIIMIQESDGDIELGDISLNYILNSYPLENIK